MILSVVTTAMLTLITHTKARKWLDREKVPPNERPLSDVWLKPFENQN